MGLQGRRKEVLCCAVASTLEQNRLVNITKSTCTAAYSSYGSVSEGVTTTRSGLTIGGTEVVTVLPLASLFSTFFVKCHRTVTKGAALFPSLSGQVVASEYTASTRGVAAQPSLSANATYLLPATVTGTQWEGHGNAVYVYTHAGTVHTFIDVSGTANLGLTVYISDEKKYYTWNGSAWVIAKSCAISNDNGAVGAEVEAYNVADPVRTTIDSLPSNLNYGFPIAGQYSGNPGGTTVTILDSRILAGDKVLCTINAGTSTGYIIRAVQTAGTITITLSADTGAGTLITWAVLRAL